MNKQQKKNESVVVVVVVSLVSWALQSGESVVYIDFKKMRVWYVSSG